MPATDSPKDAAYADLFDFLHNRQFADPVLLGRNPTPPRGVGPLGAALGILSRSSKRDLALMSQPLDFYGLNYYFPSRIAAGPPPAGTGNPDGVSEAMDSAPFHLTEWPGVRSRPGSAGRSPPSTCASCSSSCATATATACLP